MSTFFSILNAMFDVLFRPFQSAAAIWPVLFFSLVTAVLMLLVFRRFSNQTAIRTVKDRLGAHLLEVRLFQDQIRVVLRAYARLLAATGKYLLYSLQPLAVMLVPLVLLMAQMELRLGREVSAGAPVLVKAVFAPGTPLDTVELKTPEGVSITAPALRIDLLHEVDWRIVGVGGREFTLEIAAAGATQTKSFSTISGAVRRSPLRTASFLDLLLYPGEPQLTGALQSIEITYPVSETGTFGWKMHWLIPFFVFSLVFGYALKGVMGVEF